MATESDVLVIGGGIAGCAAAIAAAAEGANVCIITGAPAATALFSGAWRGPLPDGLRAPLAAAGYTLERVDHALPHPAGHRLTCDAAPPSHAAADPAGALVIGIAGLAGFHAASLARMWQASASATLELDGTPAAGWAPLSLARRIEAEPDSLARALKAAAGAARANRVVLPAVLGTAPGDAVRSRVAELADLAIGEALGVAPSLPGWRLHAALHAALRAAGVTVLAQRAVASTAEQRHVRAVTLDSGDVVRARAVVLATGKYAAGGIAANGAFRETVLDCPVWLDHLGETFEEADALILTDPMRGEEQPLLDAGVHADTRGRPVDRGGDVVYENVFAAGTVRTRWQAGAHAIGEVASDGWAAGMEAARK